MYTITSSMYSSITKVTNHSGVEYLEASTSFLSDNHVAVDEFVLLNHVDTYIRLVRFVLGGIVH